MKVYVVYFADFNVYEMQGIYQSEQRAKTEVMRLGKYYAYEEWNVD